MTRSRRRGTAPLEFALVLPLLFTIVVAGWWCVRCGLTKTAAASDARRTAWEKRADADPGIPFDLRQKPLLSAVESEIVADVPGTNPLSADVTQAKTFALMIDKTWDHEAFEFEKLPLVPISAHRKQLLHFGQFIPFIAAHGPSVAGFAAMDLMANPEFTRFIPRAIALRAERTRHIRSFVLGPIWMAEAIAECAAQAASKPLLAYYYAGLAAIISRGIAPDFRLIPEVRK